MSQSPAITYGSALLGHAWRILTFRHRGIGLTLAPAHLLLLGLIAATLSGVTALVPTVDETPGPYAFAQAFSIALVTIWLQYALIGRTVTAGTILLALITEPAGIAFKLAFEQPDTLLSYWTLAALFVFVYRTLTLKLHPQ